MRKLVSLLLMAVMLTATVFGTDFSDSTAFDKANDKIMINYSGYVDEQMAVLVYDVTNIAGATEETLWENLSSTPIIGIDQSVANGSFEIPVNADYTGTVVVVLSGQTSDTVRLLMNIVNGIPSHITVDYDAENEEVVLASNEEIVIANGKKLMNAIIDASVGKVLIGSTIVTGKMSFDENGAVDALLGSTVKLEAPGEDGTSILGFVKKDILTNEDKNYTVTLRATGEADGKTYNSTKDVVFEFGDSVYEGEVRFRIAVQGVPEGITINEE